MNEQYFFLCHIPPVLQDLHIHPSYSGDTKEVGFGLCLVLYFTSTLADKEQGLRGTCCPVIVSMYIMSGVRVNGDQDLTYGPNIKLYKF